MDANAQKWLIGENCHKLWQLVAPKLGHWELPKPIGEAEVFVKDNNTINLADLDSAMLIYEKINTDLLRQQGIISKNGDIDAAKLSTEATNYTHNRGVLGA